ncbi:LysR family transcriptional regulator substrate-binding protein [Streptomyces sp. NPDC048581]|uniref:LysR family transcriptional regulator substrate-binding protein n=1 Tax=Streptomyces sp. NPDC048581 TaxID=3365572 RepID=UPI00371942F2
MEGEPWVRFDRDSALDGVLLNVLRDNDLTPNAVARVSQTAAAVRWAAHGLGMTLVPARTGPASSPAPTWLSAHARCGVPAWRD